MLPNIKWTSNFLRLFVAALVFVYMPNNSFADTDPTTVESNLDAYQQGIASAKEISQSDLNSYGAQLSPSISPVQQHLIKTYAHLVDSRREVNKAKEEHADHSPGGQAGHEADHLEKAADHYDLAVDDFKSACSCNDIGDYYVKLMALVKLKVDADAAATADADGDGVTNDDDNCPNVKNADQRDSNGYKDGQGDGDACEGDTQVEREEMRIIKVLKKYGTNSTGLKIFNGDDLTKSLTLIEDPITCDLVEVSPAILPVSYFKDGIVENVADLTSGLTFTSGGLYTNRAFVDVYCRPTAKFVSFIDIISNDPLFSHQCPTPNPLPALKDPCPFDSVKVVTASILEQKLGGIPTCTASSTGICSEPLDAPSSPIRGVSWGVGASDFGDKKIGTKIIANRSLNTTSAIVTDPVTAASLPIINYGVAGLLNAMGLSGLSLEGGDELVENVLIEKIQGQKDSTTGRSSFTTSTLSNLSGSISTVNSVNLDIAKLQNYSSGRCTLIASGSEDDTESKSCPLPLVSPCSVLSPVLIEPAAISVRAMARGFPDIYNDIDGDVTWTVDGSIKSNTGDTLSYNPGSNMATVPITAEFNVKNGQRVKCGIALQAKETSGLRIGVKRAGDCSLFGKMRDYYFQGRARPTTKARVMGYEAEYVGQVPFKGIMNVAQKVDGTIPKDGLGNLKYKTEQNFGGGDYPFFKAVITVHPLINGRIATDPIYWQDINLDDLSQSQLWEVADPDQADELQAIKGIADDTRIFFKAHAVANNRRIKSTKFFEFVGQLDSGEPADYFIPFVGTSCSSAATFPLPRLTDASVAFPAELQNAGLCLMSKAYSLEDLRLGRVKLNLLNLTPSDYISQFPTDMLRTRLAEPECAGIDTTERDCWRIEPNNMPQIDEVATNHAQCQQRRPVWKRSAPPPSACSYDRYGRAYPAGCGSPFNCRTCNGPGGSALVNESQGADNAGATRPCPGDSRNECGLGLELTYVPGCVIEERTGLGECENRLAIRFDGYTQMMMGALICAAEFGISGTPITATLPGQGILPYNAANGGSATVDYSAGNSYTGAPNGYQCLPCRWGVDIGNTTAALPVDQFSLNARKPVFTFTKDRMAGKCVKDTTISVRYYGSEACDGVSNTPGHFCNSSVGQVTCGTQGNNAAIKSVPLCAGSDFGADEVAASWSPLILDMTGDGISVSSQFRDAVKFDMLGNGKKVIVDWIRYPKSDAFLALPNKNGEIKSIKQLFGDYKAENGFEALAKFDKNKDGRIDRNDKVFEKLRLWYDRNRDGISDQSELEPLLESGITSLPVRYQKEFFGGRTGKDLRAHYFNEAKERFLDFKDVYFYQYGENGRLIIKKSKK